MKANIKKTVSIVLTICLLMMGMAVVPHTDISAASPNYTVYAGETVSNTYGSAVESASSSNEAVLQVTAESPKVTFYAKEAGTAIATIKTAGNAVPITYQFTVKKNTNLVSVSYVGKMKYGKYNDYVYEIKNKTGINFTEMDFDCSLSGKKLSAKGGFFAYILPAKGKCVHFIRTKKNIKSPKKVKFTLTGVYRNKPFGKDETVDKNKIDVKRTSLVKGKVYGNLREWDYKMTAYNVYPKTIGYEVYGYVYDEAGKFAGYIEPLLLDEGMLLQDTKRSHTSEFYIDKSVSKPTIRMWMNAVVLE